MDANGTISIQEFHAWLTANAPTDKDGAAAMLQEMDVIEKRWAQFDDSDGDGELNLEEFEKVLRQMVTDGIADDAFWDAQTSETSEFAETRSGRQQEHVGNTATVSRYYVCLLLDLDRAQQQALVDSRLGVEQRWFSGAAAIPELGSTATGQCA